MARMIMLLGWVASACAAENLYDFSASPLTELTDANFEAEVTKDTKHVWVVEFYADWCGHCKQFAKGYEKAATNLKGLVKFGAVNADEQKEVMKTAGVQGFPSVKVYMPEVTRNPYTGKMLKTAVDYQGPRSARGVVDFATAQLPSFVVTVTDKSLGSFKANGTLPKALLFTSKTETTAMYKSFSLKLKGRMVLGEAYEKAVPKAAVEMGIASYPALLVLPQGEDSAPVIYDGDLKPDAVLEFLTKLAAEEPAEVNTPSGGSSGVTYSVEITEDNLAEVVTASKEAWLLAFESDEAPIAAPGLEGLAEQVYGQVSVGKAPASLMAKYGVKKLPAFVVLPFGTGAKSPKKAAVHEANHEEKVLAAKKAALETLPDNIVEKLTSANMDQWIGGALAGAETGAVCLLFSDKPTVPPLFRSISIEFEGKLGFGMATSNDKQLMTNFNVKKAPTLLIMYPDTSQKTEDGKAMMAGMQFTPQMHGKFNFGNIANFVAGFVQSKAGEAQSKDEARKQQPPKQAAPKKDLGPLPELSAANWEEECVKVGGLCAIALLDGAASNSNKQAHIDMLTTLRKRKHGGPLSFSWLDATCHTNFAAHFELSEMDLPALVVLSPSKKRWARNVGAFDELSLGTFGQGVASGRTRTEEIKELPTLEEGIDCATVVRGAGAYEEEPLEDDTLAEILEEERLARLEREGAVADAGSDAPAEEQKDPSKMSEIEKLEMQLELCDTTDLMCIARNDKLQKTINKKRDLEEKLKEIARKKKKKAKKAKKAAGK